MAGADKGFDVQQLFHFPEEYFHLPSGAVKFANGVYGPRHLVGEERGNSRAPVMNTTTSDFLLLLVL